MTVFDTALARLEALLGALGTTAVAALAVGLTGLVAAADLVAPAELDLSLLYIAIAAVVGLAAGPSVALVLAALVAVAWTGVDLARATSMSITLGAWTALAHLLTLVGIALVLSRMRRSIEYERDLARVDGLTGVWNERYFHERATAELAEARRVGLPVSVVLLDVDGLQALNESRGRDVGDTLLRTLGRALRERARVSDVVARLGPDEFAVLLVGTPVTVIPQVAERIRAQAQAALSHFPSATITAGAVSWESAPASVPHVRAQATETLDDAKSEGRGHLTHRVIEPDPDATTR